MKKHGATCYYLLIYPNIESMRECVLGSSVQILGLRTVAVMLRLGISIHGAENTSSDVRIEVAGSSLG